MPMLNKTPAAVDVNKKFDSKMLLVGDPGTGKTHFYCTYVGGPIHIYNFDTNTPQTLEKHLKNRNERNEITIDDCTRIDFNKVWNLVQKDQKAGLFEELAKQNGLVAFDSLTALDVECVDYVARINSITNSTIGQKYDGKKGMNQAHWGQHKQWLMRLISETFTFPCAVIYTSHIGEIKTDEGELISRCLSITGGIKSTLAGQFSEVYLFTRVKNDVFLRMSEYQKLTAITRMFSPNKPLKNITLQAIADAYVKGKTSLAAWER